MEVAPRRRGLNFYQRDGLVVGFHYFICNIFSHYVRRRSGAGFHYFITNQKTIEFVPVFFGLVPSQAGSLVGCIFGVKGKNNSVVVVFPLK